MASIRLQDLDEILNLERDWEIVWVPIDRINHWSKFDDDGVMIGVSNDFVYKVLEYAKQIREGVVFPPIIVNNDYWIADGYCRYFAHKQAGKKKIACLRELDKGSGKLLRDEVYDGGVFIPAGKFPLIWIEGGDHDICDYTINKT